MSVHTKAPVHLTAVLWALLVTFLWSTSWVLIKIGLDEIPALTFAGLRYLLAFACLLPFALLRPDARRQLRALTPRDWHRLLALGLTLYTLTQGAQFLALWYLPAQTTSLLWSFSTVVVAVGGIALLAERPTARQWSGLALYLVGATAFLYPAALPATQVLGVAVAVVGVVANASATLIGRAVNRRAVLSPLTVTVVSMGVGAVALLVTGVAVQGVPTIGGTGWLIVGWLAVVNTAFAFTLWNLTQRTLSATESSVINSTMLIQIAVLAWVLLDESLGVKEITGLGVAALGVLLVQLRGRGSPTGGAGRRVGDIPAPGLVPGSRVRHPRWMAGAGKSWTRVPKRALRKILRRARKVLKKVLYGQRYAHVPWPQRVYLRPGERYIRRLQGAWRVRRSPVVPLAGYRAATPLGGIEEFLSCPLCGESRQQPMYRPTNHKAGWRYRVVRCPGCGFLYRNPGIRPEHLGDLYATGYSRFLTGGYARNRQRRYRVTMAAVAPVLDTGDGRRLLDFGCGAGLFLELAERLGFQAYGVDLSPDSVEQARARLTSAKVFHGDPRQVPDIAAGGIDVITMWSVLAHLPRPVADLSMLRGLLTDEGALVILTVNAGSLHRRGLGSRWQGFTRNHLMFYSRDTLPRVLGAAGFASVGFAPFYGDAVADGSSSLSPAEVSRLRRRVDATDFGSMLVAVGFATEAAAERYGARLPDLRPC